MKKKRKHMSDSSEHEMYIGGLLEDMNDKIDAIFEVTAPIPKMQEDIALLQHDVGGLKNSMHAVLEWKKNINLIPTIFEEVGTIRADLENIKADLNREGKSDPRILALEKRIARIEQKIGAKL
jgi:capsule polysaccharide export protein KpsE/RkpR